MFNRLNTFLKKESVLYKRQYNFQPKRSTRDALIQITESIRFISRKITCCILLDIKKAFDTVDHSKLLQKFSEYDVRGVALEWFKSFLTNRTLALS